MLLSEIINGLSVEIISHTRDPFISYISCDSRTIRAGSIFVAVKGYILDGHCFIQQAIERGASVIVIADKKYLQQGVVNIVYYNTRKLYALLCKRLYSVQPKHILAVTGTNGKTSVVNFTQQLLQDNGCSAVSMGTLGIRGEIVQKQDLTTAEPGVLHRTLTTLASQKIDYVAMEVSSHSIEQYRVHGIDFCAGAFTNLSHDHLDYHKNMTEYFTVKKKLFSEILPKDKPVVLNSDIKEYVPLRNTRLDKIIDYGKNACVIKLLQQRAASKGQYITYMLRDKKYTSYIPLLGEFQAYNILCAIGLLYSLNIFVQDLKALCTIPGRMQLLDYSLPIIIDYAHTPHALLQALLALQWHYSHREIIVVFGCGGNRDREKRFLMGQIAAEYSHEVVVTDDNPRSEDPTQIRKEIIRGCRQAVEIPERARAIEYALAKQGKTKAVLLIAGKGNEEYQFIGNKKIPLQDLYIVKECLNI